MPLKFPMKGCYFCITKLHNTPIIVSFISLYDIPIIDTKPSGQIPLCNNYNASKSNGMSSCNKDIAKILMCNHGQSQKQNAFK